MAVTPPEEIERQHKRAQRLVKEGLPAATASTREKEISLRFKQTPVSNEESVPCVSSRGHVDVSHLVALVHEGYNEPLQNNNKSKTIRSATNLWDPANAAKNNVAIVRPSHDAWGIKKICLLFCDDFLQRVYEMPWWSDFQEAVEPIFSSLNISNSQVVRLLLAALPPGVTIPVHHDTGEWVRHTHRVHVPIIASDPSKILFECGASAATMQRVDCTPGHVFEINNQAKHAVSNCGDDHRVHLILDYVERDFKFTRIPLEAGEQILQTRRSIDRLVEKGKRPTPSFFILGAQKAGTTSLYEYMVQHPLCIRAKRRETHCLDWRWNDELKSVKDQRQHCLSFYYSKELQMHPSCLTGDSTPSYLLDARRVIPRIKRVFPHSLKFLIMLRDPVQRAHSHYQMVTSLDGTPQQIQTRGTEWHSLTFEQVVHQDLLQLKKCGLIPYWNIDEGTMDERVFMNFAGSREESQAWDTYMQGIPLNTGSHSLIARGLYELQLRPWLDAFLKEDFLVLQLERMQQDVQQTMEQVWRHLCLPSYQLQSVAAKNTRSYDDMDNDMRKYLARFYEPHNRRLASVLGMEWENVWKNDNE